jgi:hypothetical protein
MIWYFLIDQFICIKNAGNGYGYLGMHRVWGQGQIVSPTRVWGWVRIFFQIADMEMGTSIVPYSFEKMLVLVICKGYDLWEWEFKILFDKDASRLDL